VALDLPAGPYLKVEGTTLSLSILGQTLTGNFAFEQSTTSGGARVVRMAATNLALELGDGTRSLVRLTDGTGYLLLRGGGVAGQLSGSVVVDVPNVTVTGSFAGNSSMRVMHMSRGCPLISAEHEPHFPALQFQRSARSPALSAWIWCMASSTTMPSVMSVL